MTVKALFTNLKNLAVAVGATIKEVKGSVGDTNSLQTKSKTSTVAAINEVLKGLTDEAINRKAYVQSRSNGLITNGFGLLGNNTNFSKFTFDPTKGHLGKGAFKATHLNADFPIDELIPILSDTVYNLSFWLQGSGVGSNNLAYGYIAMYDIDGLSITPVHVPEAHITLERCQWGENYVIIHPDDRETFKKIYERTKNSTQSVLFNSYEYTASKGRKYVPGTYSRRHYTNAAQMRRITYEESTGKITGVSINESLPANTKTIMALSNGTYFYPFQNLRNHPTPTTATRYTLTFTPESISLSQLQKNIAAVASFMKIGWLLNRGPTAEGHESYLYGVDLRITPKLTFTGKTATVPIGTDGTELIFRNPVNSVLPMIATGVKYQGVWYGDAPSGQQFQDPMT